MGSPSVPEKRLVESDDPAVFNQQSTPGCHLAVIDVVVTYYGELRRHGPTRVIIVDFLGLHERSQALLTVLQPHGDLCGAICTPHKGEVMPPALLAVVLGNRTKVDTTTLKIDRRVG